MKYNSRAFTIVELLIVIVVIGILAAIIITAYNGVQSRANDASVRSDLNMMAKKFETFNVDNSRYPNTVAELENLGIRLNRNAYLTDATIQSNVVACLSSTWQDYTIAAISKSGTRLYVGNGKSVAEYTGATSWLGTVGNYTNMCNTTLAGSSAISSGSGWSGTWRAWTGN